MDPVRERVVQVAGGGIKTPVAVPRAALVTVMAVAAAKAPDGKDKVNHPCRGFSTPQIRPSCRFILLPRQGF